MESLVAVKTIAILGATGYLGRAVCSTVESHGWSVIRCGRGGVADSWSELSHGSVDAVVNCVGTGMNSEDEQSGTSLLEANLQVPLAAARLALRNSARLVQIGSAAQRSERLVAESPYVRSKKLASDALRLIAETDGVSVTELMPHVVFGGRDSPGVVSAMVRSIVAGNPFPLRTPDVRRDFIHRLDASRAVIAAIELAEHPWISVEIGSGDGYMLREVAAIIGELAGTTDTWRSDPGPGRPWVEDLVAEPSEAQTILGFRTEIRLREGLELMVSDAKKELAS